MFTNYTTAFDSIVLKNSFLKSFGKSGFQVCLKLEILSFGFAPSLHVQYMVQSKTFPNHLCRPRTPARALWMGTMLWTRFGASASALYAHCERFRDDAGAVCETPTMCHWGSDVLLSMFVVETTAAHDEFVQQVRAASSCSKQSHRRALSHKYRGNLTTTNGLLLTC